MSFNSFTIDLHGQTTDEATATILNALFSFEQNEYLEYFDIITGNGTGALKFVAENLLIEEKYSFSYLNNNHSVIRVYKKWY